MSKQSNKELIKTFWHFMRANRIMINVSLGLMAVTLGFELVLPMVLERGLIHVRADELAALKGVALIYLLVVLGEFASRFSFSYLISIAMLRTINRVRAHVFNHVLRMKMAFFDREPVGRLLTRTINDCEALGEVLRAGAGTILVDVLTVIGIFAIMIHLDLRLTLVMVVVAPVVWFVTRWAGEKLRKKFLDVRKALAESNGFMAEGIHGAEIIQLFNKQDHSAKEYRAINRVYRNATITSNVYDALLYSFMDAIAALASAAVLFVAFNMRFGLVEVATIIVYLRLIEKIFIPIRDLSGKFAILQQAMAAWERISGLLVVDGHIVQGEGEVDSEGLNIAFDKVSFRYQADGPLVLDNINFEVASGQVLALVGQTGSGKSTIGKLLTRAYDGYQGSIHVGDMELRQWNYHALRANIAVVHQDVELFPGTLRDNISMYNANIGDEKIFWAIDLVKARHMVDSLQGGLDFEVRENGGNLSAGQMQLIVFARALAHDAPIVLMDEATSSVDSVTEAWIQEAIFEIFKHKTVVIVAHRLSTIAAADQILVLKEGNVVERGTHQELVAMEEGYYASLVKASHDQQSDPNSVLI